MKRLPVIVPLFFLLLWGNPVFSEVAKDPSDLGYVVLENITAHSVFEKADDSWESQPEAKKYGKKEIFRQDLAGLEIVKKLRGLRKLVISSNSFKKDKGRNGPLLRDSLVQEIDKAILEILSDVRSQALPVVDYFLPIGRDKPPLISGMIFFEGQNNQVVFAEDKEGPEAAPGLSARQTQYYASAVQAIEFRAVADRLEDMFAEVRKKPFERVTVRLNEIDQSWNNYLEYGFSQYPWESVINSYVTPKILGDISWYDPPQQQIVFLHPELGVLLDTRSRKSASANELLLVHAVGYVHYFGDERNWFLGLSGTASFSDSKFGIGLGPTLHLGHSKLADKIPHITLSILWLDKTSEGPVFGIGLDLWRLFSDSGESIFRGALPLGN